MNVLMGARPMLGAGRMAGGVFYPGFGALITLGFLLFTAALVALIVWAVVRKPKVLATEAAPASDGALAIVRDRFARGEIDAEQYHSIIEALEGREASRTASHDG